MSLSINANNDLPPSISRNKKIIVPSLLWLNDDSSFLTLAQQVDHQLSHSGFNVSYSSQPESQFWLIIVLLAGLSHGKREMILCIRGIFGVELLATIGKHLSNCTAHCYIDISERRQTSCGTCHLPVWPIYSVTPVPYLTPTPTMINIVQWHPHPPPEKLPSLHKSGVIHFFVAFISSLGSWDSALLYFDLSATSVNTTLPSPIGPPEISEDRNCWGGTPWAKIIDMFYYCCCH